METICKSYAMEDKKNPQLEAVKNFIRTHNKLIEFLNAKNKTKQEFLRKNDLVPKNFTYEVRFTDGRESYKEVYQSLNRYWGLLGLDIVKDFVKNSEEYQLI